MIASQERYRNKQVRKCPQGVTRLMVSLCHSHLCFPYICEDPVQSKRSHCPLFFALGMFGSPGVSLAFLAVPYVFSYLVTSRYGFACTSDANWEM